MSEENLEQEASTDNNEETNQSLIDSDEITELKEGEYFLSEGVKGVGDLPEWYDQGKYKSVSEQAKGYKELQKKFGSFTGTPKDGYALPDGVSQDEAIVQELIEYGKEAALNQEGFDKLLDLGLKQTQVTKEVDEAAELAKLGDDAPQRIKAIENYLTTHIQDQEEYDKVKGLVNSADAVLLVESVMKATAPKKLPIDGGESPTGVTWADIEKEMFRKDDSGNMLRSVSIEHERKIQKMMKEFGGDTPNVKVFG
jgi:hypothetical protein